MENAHAKLKYGRNNMTTLKSESMLMDLLHYHAYSAMVHTNL